MAYKPKPINTFRTWGRRSIDQAVAKEQFQMRRQDQKRLRRNPEVRRSNSFMRTEWDKRTEFIYGGKGTKYNDAYGRFTAVKKGNPPKGAV